MWPSSPASRRCYPTSDRHPREPGTPAGSPACPYPGSSGTAQRRTEPYTYRSPKCHPPLRQTSENREPTAPPATQADEPNLDVAPPPTCCPYRGPAPCGACRGRARGRLRCVFCCPGGPDRSCRRTRPSWSSAVASWSSWPYMWRSVPLPRNRRGDGCRRLGATPRRCQGRVVECLLAQEFAAGQPDKEHHGPDGRRLADRHSDGGELWRSRALSPRWFASLTRMKRAGRGATENPAMHCSHRRGQRDSRGAARLPDGRSAGSRDRSDLAENAPPADHQRSPA